MFIAGSALIAGGTSILGGTHAFSQFAATRSSSIGTAGDATALLGLDVVASVQAGIDDEPLVELTNNTDGPFDVTLSLLDPGQGTLSDTSFSFASGSTRSIAVSVDRDSPTGPDALAFDVVASGDGQPEISLTRSVEVTEPPVLKQQIYDYTQYGNAAFGVSYRVSRLPDFDRVELVIENVDAGHIGPETYVEYTAETTVSYPPGGGSDGGAGGDTYEFRFRVYDQSGEFTDLYTVVSTTADGQNPPGDDLGGEDDPELVGFTVANDEQWSNNQFTVDYEVDQIDEFRDVEVVFDNQDSDWADATETSGDAPTGTVVYPGEGDHQGGVNGDTYDVTVTVYNQDDIPVDSGTVSIVAGSEDTVQWP